MWSLTATYASSVLARDESLCLQDLQYLPNFSTHLDSFLGVQTFVSLFTSFGQNNHWKLCNCNTSIGIGNIGISAHFFSNGIGNQKSCRYADTEISAVRSTSNKQLQSKSTPGIGLSCDLLITWSTHLHQACNGTIDCLPEVWKGEHITGRAVAIFYETCKNIFRNISASTGPILTN